ncbi:IS3 family transposase, partial [Endozoicomonas sp. G2_1]|nr:IS3 family transposase [Endozoicomonas sp. G2_1]
RLDWSKGTPNYVIRTSHMSKPKQLTPEQKIKALEQELADTKLKAQFFEAIVDVLDKDFGVRITKKQRSKLLNKKR